MSNEIWKDVVGYEGLYRVSDFGRVWSVRRKGVRGQWIGGRPLKPCPNSNGYLFVNLWKGGHRHKTAPVHRMVLEAFIGLPPSGQEGCHRDGYRTHNRLGNLRWDTREGNQADRRLHGTANVGQANPRARLCELDVWLIRSIDARQADVANFFGINRSQVSRIRTHKTWSHLKDQAA